MLTVQFGQCGNQLGNELFGKITSDIESRNAGLSFQANYDYSEASCERWFSGITKDGKRIARAILVDTEKKVVDKILGNQASNASWRYSSRNTICQSHGGGSGNNWAYGYCVKAKELENAFVDAVRSETEKSDRLDGFLGLLGCAGGTGSGVGSGSLELLRDEFATKTILASLILPFASGEVGTQNYNSLLTVAKFSDLADAVVLMENDQLLRVCTSVVGERRNEERFLEDMNVVAAEKLVSALQPVREVRNEANHFASTVTPHPGYKMATIKCTAPLKLSTRSGEQQRLAVNSREYESGSLKWQVHVRQLKHTLRIAGGAINHEVRLGSAGNSRTGTSARANAESVHHAYRRSIANMLITRGYSSVANIRNEIRCENNDPMTLEQLTESELYPAWIPKDRRLTHLHQRRRLLERDKFATLVTNNSQICESLDSMVDKAWNCYTNGAFLHRYKQYGLEDDDFLRAFAKVENVVKLYGELDGQ